MTPSCLHDAYSPDTLWVAWYLPHLLEGITDHCYTRAHQAGYTCLKDNS